VADNSFRSKIKYYILLYIIYKTIRDNLFKIVVKYESKKKEVYNVGIFDLCEPSRLSVMLHVFLFFN
jgi:hypothetical protein